MRLASPAFNDSHDRPCGGRLRSALNMSPWVVSHSLQ